MSIKDLCAFERPREKMSFYGAETLSDAELLAILIGHGYKGKSALVLAQELLEEGGRNLGFLGDCLPEELSKLPGIGMAKASQIVAACQLGKRMATRPVKRRIGVNNPEKIANLFMEKMRYYKKEFFSVIILNTKLEIISLEDVFVGTANTTLIHPREVFSKAIRLGANGIILVHNHPSGNPEPSQQDRDITLRLAQSGNLLGIKIFDHIIIGDGSYFSFKEMGLPELTT